MTAAEINRGLESLDKLRAMVNKKLIDAGRGHETSSETATKHDPLSDEWNEISARQGALRNEVERRAGPGVSRLPKGRGFGPLKL